MRRVAIIPARGGSKRFPRKNIAPFFGHPLLSYTIRSGIESGCFDQVVVSTDDDEIENIGLRYGANVDRRPTFLGADAATVREVCLDFLRRQRRHGIEWDVLCCLYATAALMTIEDIRSVLSLIEPGICEYAMGVSRADRHMHQALDSVGDSFLKPKWSDLVESRSQEANGQWFSNGTIYAVWVPAFGGTGSFYGPTLKGHFMPRDRAIDIDHPEDLELAKFYFARQGADRLS